MLIQRVSVAFFGLIISAGCLGADVQTLVKKCAGCHGENGVSKNSDVPVIAGFSYYGFIDTLNVFREGERIAMEFQAEGTPETTMNQIATALSDEEVEALAEFYSSRPFEPQQQEFDPILAARGKEVHEEHCALCHSAGGSDPQDDAAILAGQWTPYLLRQFENIESGKRRVPRGMKRRFDRLSAEDKEALLNYYASQY
jgi:sulfide dehydrogenase cytochrome subunit